MAARRVYEDWEKAHAVSMFDGLVGQGRSATAARRDVASRLGIPASTVRSWTASPHRTAGASATSSPNDAPARSRWLRRPLAWLAAATTAVVTAGLVAALAPRVSDAIAEALESGSPVVVDSAREFRNSRSGDSVVFPSGTPFTDADLAELNRIRDEDPAAQAPWLESRGGMAAGAVYVELAVSGNRSHEVRIVDVDARPRCTAPVAGVLFDNPAAGQDDSVPLLFDLDRPGSPPMVEVDGTTEDYFPTRTVSLDRDEQQVFTVIAGTDDEYCSFDLVLTVLDGDARVPVEVAPAGGGLFEVSAQLPNDDYEAVYLGGVYCDPWVRASEAYILGDYSAACTG